VIPFFSVVVPVYNRATLLPRAIDSLLNQEFRNFEIIIVDDGSTDETEKVVSSFQDNRIKYFKQVNRGVTVARNLGASKATGAYLLFLDSDDEVSRNWLGEFDGILRGKQFKLAFCAARYFRDNDCKTIYPARSSFHSNHKVNMLAGAFAISASLFSEIGGYDANIYFGENFELGIRACRAVSSVEIGITDSPLLLVHVGERSERRMRYNAWKELKSSERMIELYADHFKEANPRFLSTLYAKSSVAYLLTDNLRSSLLRSSQSLRFHFSAKPVIRYFAILLAPNLYKKWLGKRDYLP
jgi:glycosyltransferase involved in cell wall biosynthesis